MKKLEGLGKVLKREQQKKVIGGVATPCSMTYQDPSGAWHTESGSCSSVTMIYSTPGGPVSGTVSFCYTQSFHGPVPLSSNGGTSKCAAAA